MRLVELAQIAIEHGESKPKVNSTINPLRRHHIETIEEFLEDFPDERLYRIGYHDYARTKVREFGAIKHEYMKYLIQKYYQPAQDVYERRDTFGGEYDI